MASPTTREYFEHFPKINLGNRQVVDLTKRVAFLRYIRENPVFVGEYMVKDGETPWSLAQDFYGSPNFHWIILHLNNIIDPIFGWVMSIPELDAYIESQYPGMEKFEIRHWVLEDRLFSSDPEHPLARSVTFKDWLEFQNERRRKIVVLRPQYITQAQAEFEKKMRAISS